MTSKPKLSPRQLEIMAAIAAGDSDKEISSDLGISEHTIKQHRKDILQRLSCRNMFQAIFKFSRIRKHQKA